MKGRAHPSPFAALAFPNLKKAPIHSWVDREEFSSCHMAKPSLGLTTLQRLSVPLMSCSNRSTRAREIIVFARSGLNFELKTDSCLDKKLKNRSIKLCISQDFANTD